MNAPLRRSTCEQISLLVERADADADEREQDRRERLAVAGQRHLVPDDEPDAREPQREPEPLPRHDPLAEPDAREHHGEDRLQSDEHRRHAGRHAGRDRDEHAAQVDAVDEPCRDDDVPRFAERRRPLRAHRQRDAAHQRRDEHEPVEEELERRRVREAVLRGDEAGAPQQRRTGTETRAADARARRVRWAYPARSGFFGRRLRGSAARRSGRCRPGSPVSPPRRRPTWTRAPTCRARGPCSARRSARSAAS